MTTYISSVRKVRGRIVITKHEIAHSTEEKISLPRVNLANTVSPSTTELGKSLFDTENGPKSLKMPVGDGIHLPAYIIHHLSGPWNVISDHSG